MPDKNDNLEQLFGGFLNEAEARQAADDIRLGEGLLSEYPAPLPNARLLEEIKAEVSRSLATSGKRVYWVRRAVAVAAAQENIQRNDATQIVTVAQGSLDRATGVYDLVVVNILAKVIISLAREGLAERVRSEGQWVTAGIIETQVAEVVAILEAAGLRVTEKRQIADWVTLIGHKV